MSLLTSLSRGRRWSGYSRHTLWSSVSSTVTPCHVPRQTTSEREPSEAPSRHWRGRPFSTLATTTSACPHSQLLVVHPTLRSVPSRRDYHATPQRPLVLYATIIIVTAAGYVIYRKSQGKPIAPDSLIDAKREFQETQGKFSRAAFERRQQEKRQQQQKQPDRDNDA